LSIRVEHQSELDAIVFMSRHGNLPQLDELQIIGRFRNSSEYDQYDHADNENKHHGHFKQKHESNDEYEQHEDHCDNYEQEDNARDDYEQDDEAHVHHEQESKTPDDYVQVSSPFNDEQEKEHDHVIINPHGYYEQENQAHDEDYVDDYNHPYEELHRHINKLSPVMVREFNLFVFIK